SYVGLNKLSTASWAWSDGSNSNYTNWSSGQPPNNSNCAVLNSADGTWQGVSCNTAYPYVCAFTAYTPAPTCPPCPTPAGCPTFPHLSKAGSEYKKETDLTWIGLKQKDYPTSSEFTWTDGTPFDYKNWGPSQPDDKRGKMHCTQTHSDYLGRIPAKDNNYQHWDVCECTLVMRAYVCKKAAYH
ncbi:unnamed protein product, partial [Strongylus vulgaris]